jgi:hypothetical protein
MRVGFQSCGNTTGRPSPAQMGPLSGLIKTLWIHHHRPDEPTHGERTSRIMATVERLDERFHENDPMGFDPTFVIPGCVPAGDSRSERRPGIHSPCGGYGLD